MVEPFDRLIANNFFLRSTSQDHCETGTKCEQFTYFMGNPVFETCYLNSFAGNNFIYEEFIMKERYVCTILITKTVKLSKQFLLI